MTLEQAQVRATRLGLSAWQAEAIQVGEQSHAVLLHCVGFADLGIPVAESSSWEEAFEEAARIIFAA
jgi:hypothetical protein